MSNKTRFAPVAIFAALAVIVTVLWQWVEREQVRNIHRNTAITAEQMAIRLETFISTRTALVDHIADEWATGEVHDQATFYEESRRLYRQFPGILAISWVDSQGIIRWVTPTPKTGNVVGINVHKRPISGPVFEKAERTGLPQITLPFELVQGGKGIALYKPVKRNGDFDGTIASVYRISDLIEAALRTGVRENYFFTITDGDFPVYNFGQVPEAHPYLASSRLGILDRAWTVSLMPTPALIALEGTRAGQTILLIGLLLSAGLAWLLRLYLLRHQAMGDSERRFRSIFEGGVAGNIVIDENGIIEEFNTAAERQFGYRSSEVLGRNVSMLMPEPDSSRHDGYLERYLKTGQAKVVGIGREVTALRKDGVSFPIHLGIAEIAGGDHRTFIGSITDLTEIKALEDQLLHAQKMEAVGQLTGGLAHDFNNLLATTLGNAQLLERKLAGQDDLLSMVKPIIRAARRGAELTHRLLAFSRKQALQPESVQMDRLCEGMRELLMRSLGGAIDIEIAANDRAWNVLADPGQLESALLNLAINARHAMADGGNLTIRVENLTVEDREWAGRWEGKPGEYVALSVADTGTGIPPDVIEHVFEPFFTTKEVGQGSGLGLSMVYGFAQQSGGFTAIESEPGSGTTVTIYLPRDGSVEIGGDAPAAEPELQESRGETVLLVEDEADVRDITTKLLISLGYTVLAVEDGAGAVEIASGSGRIDLLISDMVLPGGMNGIEICNRIREQRPGMKCVFMSGYSTITDEELPEGTEILAKPVAMDDLAAKSRQILDA